MQKRALKVDSKKEIACHEHETDKPLCNSEGAVLLFQCYNLLVQSKNVLFASGFELERLRYPMQVKGQSSYREPIHLSTVSRRTSRLGWKAFI